MFYNSKERKINIEETDMDYIEFGNGNKNLIIIPGLGDGLRTVKGSSFSIARMYRDFLNHYKIYVFSRKNKLEEGYTTRQMASDMNTVMKKLNINKADIFGISQGGMIAQYIAIDYPEVVNKLVIAVSSSKKNETIEKVVGSWIDMAKKDDYKTLILDTLDKNFTEEKLKKYRWAFPIIKRIGKPKDFSRFIIQGESCINHNSYDELEKIKSPTLVIGGDSDKIVGKNSSEDIASKIEKSKLIIYKGLGHGAYEETKDFNIQVLKFLLF